MVGCEIMRVERTAWALYDHNNSLTSWSLDQTSSQTLCKKSELTPILSNCSPACRRVVRLFCNVTLCDVRGVASRHQDTTGHHRNYSPIISHSEPSWTRAGAGVSVTRGTSSLATPECWDQDSNGSQGIWTDVRGGLNPGGPEASLR